MSSIQIAFRSLITVILTFGIFACSSNSGGTPDPPPPDTTSPFITKTTPASEDNTFDPNVFLEVVFNENIAAVDSSQVFIQKFNGNILDVNNNIPLKNGSGNESAYGFDTSKNTLIIRPKINALQAEQKYQVTVQNIKDTSGNVISKSCIWIFATNGYPNFPAGNKILCKVNNVPTTNPLKIVDISISDQQPSVRIDSAIKIKFNKSIKTVSLTKQNFSLQPATNSPYIIEYLAESFTVVLKPNLTLLPNANYTLDIASEILSETNQNLGQAKKIAFTTLPLTKNVVIAHRTNSSISVYAMNEATGALSFLQEDTNLSLYPTNALFNNLTSIISTTQGPWIYTSSSVSSTIQALSIDTTGTLIALVGTAPLNYSVQNRPFISVSHPTLPFIYVPSSTNATSAPAGNNLNSYIHVFNIQPDGSLIEVLTANTDNASKKNIINTRTAYPSIVKISPNGQFLFASDFQGSVLSAYRIDQVSGQLTEVAGSPFKVVDQSTANASAVSQTLGIAISPNNKFVYVSNFSSSYSYAVNAQTVVSSSISVLSIDQTTGQLTRVGSPFLTGINPYEMEFAPDGKHLYVALFGENDGQGNAKIARYSIQSDGSLLNNNYSVNVSLNPATIRLDPSHRYLFIGHLGSANTVEEFYLQPDTNNLIPVNTLTALSATPFTITFTQ